MNKIIKLTKVLWKNISNKNTEETTDNKMKKKKFGSVILYAFLILYLFGTFGMLAYNTINSLLPLHQEGLFIGILFMAIIAMIIFTSIFSCTNVFYFSKDIEYLLPMPLKPRDIFISKFLTLLIYQYFVEAMFMLPCIIVYGLVVSTGILYWLYSILVLLILPIVPLIISTLIVMIIMSFSKLTKYKDRFQLFTGLCGIALAFGIQLVPQMFMNSESEFDVQILVEKANSAIGLISNYFPTLGSATNTLVHSADLTGFAELIKFVGLTILISIVFIAIGEKIYFKGISGNNENAKSNKNRSTMKNIGVKQNQIKSFTEKELKILFRNPIYFMQCVMPSFAIPILFFIIAISSKESNKELIEMFTVSDLPSSMILFICLIVMEFFSSLNYSTVTAISRDGRLGATFSKTLPMPLYEQLISKMIPGLLLDTISIAISIILLKLVLGISFSILIYAAILGFIFALVRSYLLIIVDLKKPKLDWDSEYAVVKQNMNMFYEGALNMILIGIMIAGCVIFAKIDTTILFVSISVLLLLILKIVDLYFIKKADILYEKIS